jgi:hypothetical protein
MAILRAGPWGNLTDSFQNVPGDTGADGLTLYPVNCAKTDWLSGQAWGAYYEVEESGCCTPETVSITGAYLSSMTRNEFCEYYESYGGTPPTYFDYYTQSLSYDSGTGTWNLFWSSAFFIGDAYLTNNDGCDPTGTYADYYGGSPVVSTP